MARRSDHTREELRELAIEAGIELIEEKGFPEFSARAVAAKIGYTVGTLYHVFESLDNFILHINARTLDLWYEELKNAIDRKRDPIDAVAEASIDFCRTHANRWSALYEHHLPAAIELPDWYAPKIDRLFALAEESLERYTKRNQRKAKRAAKVLWAGIHGLCMLSISRKLDTVGAETAEVLAKDFVKIFLAGLKATGSTR